jgi:hypothetical protein
MDYQKKLIDLSENYFLVSRLINLKQNRFLFYVYDESIVNHRI